LGREEHDDKEQPVRRVLFHSYNPLTSPKIEFIPHNTSKSNDPIDMGRLEALGMSLWWVTSAHGWSVIDQQQQRIQPPTPLQFMDLSDTRLSAPSRRALLGRAVRSVALVVLAPGPASAATITTGVIAPEEIARIQTGWEQINYLLDHFEEETTVCRENGGECKRDANAIRKVLGLRSTTDPLFQIDKVFAKFKLLPIDDFDQLDALYDAAEDWNSSISMSNSMAFISQFGEYNPGGGKDEVLKYLLEARKQVVLARDALKTIMVNLDIPRETKNSP
jgi:hypothetical protein